MADKKSSADKAPGYVIEEGVRLSDSLLWDLQRAYYTHAGIEAWKSGTVPSYITTNAFIAQAYARVIHASLIDRARVEGEGAAPVHIIELGAGHGRFGFMVLRKLHDLVRQSPIPVSPFCYVMTDLVQKNIDYWRRQESLRPFVDRGLLDFACFDVERGGAELTLQHSGRVISAEAPVGSMVVIANYLFDSLLVDVFRVHEGVLEESRVRLTSSRKEEPDLQDPEVIGRLDVAYEHVEATDSVYDDPEMMRILDIYKEKLGDTAFLLPVGAIRAIRTLEALTGGQLMVLSADKGYNHAHQLLGHGPPSLVRHGSFSFSVNYHAIGLYFRERGGFSLHTSERGGSIEVSAFILQGTPAESYATCMAFQKEIEEFGPVDFFLLQRDASKLEGTPTLAYCLSLIRLSGYDPEIFYDLRVHIRDQAETAPEEVQQETARALARVWDLFYMVGDDRDVPFAMGRIYHRMGQHQQAIQFYMHSTRLFGDDRATFYNIGLCHHKVGQNTAALHYFDKALAVDPGYSYARDWKLRVQAEMRRSSVSWEAEPGA